MWKTSALPERAGNFPCGPLHGGNSSISLSVEYEENMELIDTRINSYYNLANTRIMQMASSRVRLENLLGDFLDRVSRISKEEQDAAMEKGGKNALVLSTRNTLVTNHSSRIGVSATKVRISH